MSTLHTKYRPETFKEVVGHTEAAKSIERVLHEGKSQVFLFTGPSGCGKTTLARIIANTVGCEPHNLIEIDAATNNGIDDMRKVTEGLLYAALGKNPAKVIILDEAHGLSKQAWQSLLKSIEEPPKNVYWCICTTEGDKIPETIRTRCVCYDLKPIATDEIHKLLQEVAESEKMVASDDVLFLIAEKAQGSPRRALTLLSQAGHCKTRKEAVSLLKNSTADEGEAIDLCRLLVKGASWSEVMEKVNAMKDQNPEGIRIVITHYLTTCILGTKDPSKAGPLIQMLDCFIQPYPHTTNVGPLLVSLASALLGG